MMKNQSGFITVDFIFAITMLVGLTALLFTVTFTLSVASVTQYITYSAARNYQAAHITQDLQAERAKAKYEELINNAVFKPLYSQNWFKVDADPTIGDHTKVFPEYDAASDGVNTFWGVGTRFVAPILDFKIPFFGSTAPESDGSGNGFATYLASYLGREPSEEECLKFTADRWSAIRRLSVSGGASYDSGNYSSDAYVPMADDGC